MKNVKLTILDQLHSLIHSKENLWKEVANLTRTYDYMVTEEFSEKVTKELQVVEQHVGETIEVKKLKDLIASLTPSSPQLPANRLAA